VNDFFTEDLISIKDLIPKSLATFINLNKNNYDSAGDLTTVQLDEENENQTD